MNTFVWLRESAPEEPEAVIIKAALETHQGAIKLFNLPAAYCQIFDLMRSAGEPVIEALQASRVLKKAVDDQAKRCNGSVNWPRRLFNRCIGA